MKRRTFLQGLLASAAAGPVVVRAAAAVPAPRVVVIDTFSALVPSTDAGPATLTLDVIRQAIRIMKQNDVGAYDQVPVYAGDLVAGETYHLVAAPGSPAAWMMQPRRNRRFRRAKSALRST